MEKKLWNRRLSCGHDRLTNLHYLVKDYEKPKVGDLCFCRVCNNNVNIIEVTEERRMMILRELNKIKRKLEKERKR